MVNVIFAMLYPNGNPVRLKLPLCDDSQKALQVIANRERTLIAILTKRCLMIFSSEVIFFRVFHCKDTAMVGRFCKTSRKNAMNGIEKAKITAHRCSTHLVLISH